MTKLAVQKFAEVVIDKSQHKDQAREHAYRPALENLFHELLPEYKVFNDPARSEYGNPDFALLKNKTPRCYAETKDITKSLDDIENSEQIDRYLGYPNLILTNNLEFRFYRHGAPYGEPVTIIEQESDGTLRTVDESRLKELQNAIQAFVELPTITVKRAGHLAGIMGKSAQRIRTNVFHYIDSDSERNEELIKQYDAFRDLLINDLSKEDFADMYAQTLVYGLFAARYNDSSLETFSRREARDLVPKTNPFLRRFFDHIAGESFDDRLEIIVDELCDIFVHTDVHDLMHQYYRAKDLFGGEERSPDPVIHFYEDFLKEYDSQKKIDLGVFYTPPAVVSFITRSIDELLKEKFNLADGLADTTTTSRLVKTQEISKDSGTTQKRRTDLHRVQILDPAVGTGTFLNEIIRHIREDFKGQEGRWPAYVDDHLLPRLYGFELMMASYTIAHLKLGITLNETGYTDFKNRLGIYLTNSLEKPRSFEDDHTLFGVMDALTKEAKEASTVKRDTPIMVVVGNPPYSGESSNAFYTDNDVYKVEPGGKQKLQERNSKWINDDYVKFIRFAESQIEATGEGIVGMITAHGYIDNPTFRGMRWHLMKTFNEIYILDLHGNINKKEVAPDGSKDENVFDIKTGVAVIFGVKNKDGSSNPATVYHADLYGKRAEKYDYLQKHAWNDVEWKEVKPQKPELFFYPYNYEKEEEYKAGVSINELFPNNSVGIVTSRDYFVIDYEKQKIGDRIKDFLTIESNQEAKDKYSVRENKRWKVKGIRESSVYNKENIREVLYRPFDKRFLYYDDNFIERSRRDVMKHFVNHENIGLITKRGVDIPGPAIYLSDCLLESRAFSNPGSQGVDYYYPIYLYAEDNTLFEEGRERKPNLDKDIIEEIVDNLDLDFVQDHADERAKKDNTFTPLDVLDYCYAVIHSPHYREKYQEFLKIDFPRVPFTDDTDLFFQLAEKGGKLRKLHLLEDISTDFDTTFPENGSMEVIKHEFEAGENNPEFGKVWINDEQYFGDVPKIAWEFYIGGYQPLQKWLYYRKRDEVTLTDDDIVHFQKIIVALTQTDKAMQEINELTQDF